MASKHWHKATRARIVQYEEDLDMPINQAPFTGLGPFQSLFNDSNYTNFTKMAGAAMPVGMDQLMRGMSRWQLEMQGLVNRRAQAYLELPSRISQCRTPQDLMQEQQRFWQTAFEQYSEYSRHIMSAWSQMAQMPAAGAAQQPTERDYLAFPEPRAANGVGQQTRAGDRRVA